MYFFGKNLKMRHKLTLCLVLLGIVVNAYLWSTLPQIPFIQIKIERWKFDFSVTNYTTTHTALAYGTFIKIIVLWIFRKF